MILCLALGGPVLAGVGMLAPGDEQLPSGEYIDRVLFTGAAGDEVVIELTSTEFDPYLILFDADNNAIAQEDDSPGAGPNVRVTVRLPSFGQFTVIVTSALPGETGAYSLTLGQPSRTPSAAASARPDAPTRPRTVSGRAVDSQGRPIAGARVWIVPALTTGVVEVRTDADGNYLVEGLLDVPYRPRAWMFADYGGVQLCLRLGMDSPVDYDTFTPSMGAVRNFRLQLTGPIEDLRDTQEQFGGVLSVWNAWPYEDAGNRIEFTFTPTGPLVDGSWIEPFVRVVDPDRDTEIRGLPIGPYRVDATLVGSDGSRLALNVAEDSYEQYGPSMNLDWTSDGTCSLISGVDWEYLYLELSE